ncbi:MAG TPA: ATP-binding cassette domain-containing protein, partial [Candidatus Methylacidiphilales bacterium]|nr:ATP-binding cassette domain-containing protein [Candidatus Methylacidiphilales bacterium]
MNHAPKTLMEMHGIKLRLAGKEILAGVDLSLRPQATLVVMGLSGGGKTTLLRILLGLLPASEGSVRFRDRELTTLSRAELNQIRTHIGMVYQNAALISSMSVRDNVALPLKELSDKSEREIEAIVEEKLKL